MLDVRQSVAKVVLEHNECASVFYRHNIDYCCHGAKSIEAACAEQNLGTHALMTELSRAIAAARSPAGNADPRALSTAALIEHIVSKHHAYLRRTLPLIERLSEKVSRVHGDRDPKLRIVEAVVHELAETLMPHMDAEEQELFPSLLESETPWAFRVMELMSVHREHFAVGRLLGRLRSSMGNFAAPDWACASYRALAAELARMEGDLFTHVLLENHVLEPRFGRILVPERMPSPSPTSRYLDVDRPTLGGAHGFHHGLR